MPMSARMCAAQCVVISDLLECLLARREPLEDVHELHAADGIEHGGPLGATGQVLEQ